MSRDLRIGVALGGGGAAALSCIGVLEQLLDAGIAIDCIAGTSAGAIVGASAAAGHLRDLHEAMASLSRGRYLGLFDLILSGGGLLGGRRGMDLIAPYIGDDIENLPTAFAAVATDLESGAEVILDRGPVYDAVRASIAIPGVFRPHRIDGRFLVDGGLSNPIPVSVARALGADFVLAVSVLRIPGHGEDGAATALAGDVDVAEAAGQDGTLADAATADHLGVLDVLSKGSAVVQSHIAAARLRVDPPDQALFLEMENIGLFQLRRSAEAIESGRQAALAAMPQILAAIEEARRAREHPIRHWISSALARPRSI